MKLSDIKGEAVLEVMADIIEPIMEIADDKDAMELFERKPCPKGKTPQQFVAERLKKGIPALLKNHKSAIIAILAAISMESVEEYSEGLNMAKLLKDVTELLTDEEFLAFLS